MDFPHSARRSNVSWALAIAVGCVAALQLAPFLTATPLQLTLRGRLIDDAFFYAILARNYVDLGFLTFDGEMPTNGVQPLWMAVLIGMKWLLPRADEIAVLSRISWATYVAFAGVATWFVATGRGWAPYVKTGFLAALVVLNPRFQDLSVQGLETPLMLLVLTATIVTVDRAARGSAIGVAFAVLLGFLSGLCFLSRTDLLWVAPVLFVLVVARARRKLPAVVAFSATVAAVVLPYLAHNLASQGAFTPISGRVKLHYMSVFLPDLPSYLASDEWKGMLAAIRHLPLLGRLPEAAGLVVAAAVLAGIFFLVLRDLRRPQPMVSSATRVLAVVVLIHALFMHLAYRELRPYTAYYFAPALLLIGIVTGAWAASLVREPGPGNGRSGRKKALVLAVLVVALGDRFWSSATRSPAPDPMWAHRVEISREARRILGPDARLAAFWPGTIAWFSGLPTVPLDGVIGSNAFLHDYVMAERELDYPLERGIDHVIALLPAAPEELFGPSPPEISTWSALGTLRLWERRHDLSVVARSTWVPGGGGWYLLRVGDRQVPS